MVIFLLSTFIPFSARASAICTFVTVPKILSSSPVVTEIVKDVSQTVPIVDIGSPLPLSPDRQYNIRLRRDGTFKGNPSYTQFAYKSASETYNSFESAKVLEQADYQVLDLAFGMTLNDTDIEFFVRNLTDERANLYYNDQDDIPRITTNRPRNIGVRVSRNF